MNVGDLRRLLEGHDEDTLVVLSKDAEGNGFSPLDELDEPGRHRYFPSSTWAGEVEGADEVGDDGEKVVVLWPVN